MKRWARSQGFSFTAFLLIVALGASFPAREGRALFFVPLAYLAGYGVSTLAAAVDISIVAGAVGWAMWPSSANASPARSSAGGYDSYSPPAQVVTGTPSTTEPGTGDTQIPPAARELDRKIRTAAGVKPPKSRASAVTGGNQRDEITKARENAESGAKDAEEQAAAARRAADLEKQAADQFRQAAEEIAAASRAAQQAAAGLSPEERAKKLNEPLNRKDDLKELFDKAGIKNYGDLMNHGEEIAKNLENGADHHQGEASQLLKDAKQADEAANALRNQGQRLADAGNNLGADGNNNAAANNPGTISKGEHNQKIASAKGNGNANRKDPNAEYPILEKAQNNLLVQAAKDSNSEISKQTTDYPSGDKMGLGKKIPGKEEGEVNKILGISGKKSGAKKEEGNESDNAEEAAAVAKLDPMAQTLRGMAKIVRADGTNARAIASVEGNEQMDATETANAAGATSHIEANITIFKRVSQAIERCQVKQLDCVH